MDITDYLKQDETLLTVSVDNSSNHVYPQSTDFTFYGGLYRSVKLVMVLEAHFDLDCCGAPGIKVTPVITDLERRTVEVTVETWVKNAGQIIFTVDGQEQTAPVEGARHQDREGLGNALTLKEHREDVGLILEMGANTVRMTHYQHAQEFYDLCDENVLVV